MALHPEALARFSQLLDELHDLVRGAGAKPEKKIVSMVGLSMGEHEEVCDANYKRQPIEFIEHTDGFWRNVKPVFFPVAVGTYGADSIVVEGVDIQKKIVARMADPVMCIGGQNGLGFAPTALSVSADVMRMATTLKSLDDLSPQDMLEPEQAPVSDEFQRMALDLDAPRRDLSLADAYKKHLLDHTELWKSKMGQLRGRGGDGGFVNDRVFTLKNAVDALPPPDEREPHAEYYAKTYAGWDDLGLQKFLAPLKSMEREPEPTEEAPLYCDHCERISLPRRNQLISMGHSTSHLVELPNELGYALPCKSCRER